jgi:hypothetical protein
MRSGKAIDSDRRLRFYAARLRLRDVDKRQWRCAIDPA